MYSDGIEQKMYELRDKAIIRLIDLTSEEIKLQNRINEIRSEKKRKEIRDKMEYIAESIEKNRDIVFHVADLDKEYQLEQ